ncbi:Tubby-like protein 8 [Bienertia sinuspersici]
MNEPDSSFGFGLKVWDANEETESAKSVNIWDYSDSEAAPVSSWSTLPNRALLCRTLPMDVGKCTCFILKEAAPQGFGGGSLYSLYTNNVHSQSHHDQILNQLRVKADQIENWCCLPQTTYGRSVFVIAQNTKGLLSNSDDSFIGVVTANLMGSRYYVWNKPVKHSRLVETIVEFTPTIATWTGRHRRLKAWIAKQQPQLMQMQSKKSSANQVQNMKGLPLEWEGKIDQNQVHVLSSRVPCYNKLSKKYELDFRDKVREGNRIQSSVKNFQLTMEGNGGQTILQLGRVGKSKFVLDYR